MHDEPLHLGAHHQLAAEPAVRAALAGGEFEHLVLGVLHLWSAGEIGLLDIDVAGGAHRRAAAFGDDAVDTVEDRGLHDAGADRHLQLVARPVGMDVNDLGHASFRLWRAYFGQRGGWRQARVGMTLTCSAPAARRAPSAALLAASASSVAPSSAGAQK